jgi:putative phosphoribosyl transferase
MEQQQFFHHRKAAGIALSRSLIHLKGSPGIVLAIPRGGVPVALEIAKALHFPLDILLSKKIGHPANPEFAIGAVTLEDRLLSPDAEVPLEYIEQETNRIRQELDIRNKTLRGERPALDVCGKIVVIVDDGIATGLTLQASIQMIRRRNPARIVLAVPVAPAAACRLLRPQVDELVVLHTPTSFSGVGAYYRDFSQVEDAEVVAMLRNH